MLIGNRNRFAIGIEPLAPSWERRFRPERAAWARLSIWIGGTNICRNLLDGSNTARDGLNIPLAPLADWFVRSWTFLEYEERPRHFPLHASPGTTILRWGEAPAPAGFSDDDWLDAREGWRSRHFLAAGADGAYLPNLALIRGDERLFVEWAPARFAGPAAPLFLAESGRHAVAWAEAKAVLARFVAYVANWLRESGVGDIYPWVGRGDPLNEAVPAFSAALQAYTGIAAEVLRERTNARDDADLRGKLGLPADGTDPGGSVVTQVLRDLPPGISDAMWDRVWILERETRSDTGCAEGLNELRGLAQDAARPASDPETSGYLAAQGLRNYLGLGGQPIGEVDEQLSAFGVKIVDSGLDCTQGRMLAGARRGCGSAAVINRTPRTATAWGRRFEAVRALGHILLDAWRQDAIGAASAAFAQPWARRRSGAFAAEFLLPGDALREEAHSLDSYAGPESFAHILEAYGVGATTAAYHLWNRGFLSSSQIRDDLIDRFSSTQH